MKTNLNTCSTPFQVDAIQRRLLEKVDGVLAVHEFHVWQLAGDRIIASAHIRCRNLSEYMKIAEKVKEFFHNEGIHSTTIQPEFVEGNDGVGANGAAMLMANGDVCGGGAVTANGRLSNGAAIQDSCALDCPITDQGCVQSTCCQTSNKVGMVGDCVRDNGELIDLLFCFAGPSSRVIAQRVSVHVAATVVASRPERCGVGRVAGHDRAACVGWRGGRGHGR